MIGQTISHYRITEQIGEGGMGVVYKALDTKLDRSVAIKFLPPHLQSDQQAKKRFMHEAKAASALNHANIAVVHEIGESSDGQMFIVMAYYEGQTLKEKIEGGLLEVNDAIAIVFSARSRSLPGAREGHPAPGHQTRQIFSWVMTGTRSSPTSVWPSLRGVPR